MTGLDPWELPESKLGHIPKKIKVRRTRYEEKGKQKGEAFQQTQSS